MYRKVYLVSINVREYRRGNQIGTIQRNWQHTVNKTRIKTQSKNTTQYMHGSPHVNKQSEQIEKSI
jgi:lysozyme family protein